MSREDKTKKASATWLDRAIGWVDPEAGRKRHLARLQITAMNSYEGARRTRHTEGWKPKSLSANEAIRYDLETLRDRARDLVRNTPYGEKAVTSLAANMIGTGIVPRIRGERAQEMQRLWQQFCMECDFDGHTDFYGLQNLAARTVVESGEALVIFKPARRGAGLKIPLQLQVLEPDFIDSRKNVKQLEDGGEIIQGIQFNRAGQRVGYWLYERHPGDGRRVDSRFVGASEVLHLYRKKRPGQVRGVSWFAPVMLKMRDLDDYDEAELLAKKISACFGVIVTLNGDAAATMGQVSTESGTGKRLEDIEPGMVGYLKGGEDIKTITPQLSQGYPDYTRKHLHDLAAGLNLTYEILTGDLSQVNYSSYRAGQIDLRQIIDQQRWHLWVPGLCQPVWQRFSNLVSVVAGIEDASASVEWSPPRHLSVDPWRDYKALQTAVRSGFMSQQQAVGEFGDDWQMVVQETEEMNRILDEKAITWDTDPRRKDLAGGDQQQEQQNNKNGE